MFLPYGVSLLFTERCGPSQVCHSGGITGIQPQRAEKPFLQYLVISGRKQKTKFSIGCRTHFCLPEMCARCEKPAIKTFKANNFSCKNVFKRVRVSTRKYK